MLNLLNINLEKNKIYLFKAMLSQYYRNMIKKLIKVI